MTTSNVADVLHFSSTAPWSNQPDFAGVSAKLFYFRATAELGVLMDIEQALPDCDQGGAGMAPRLDVEVYLSHEWRLWQPMPPHFQYTVLHNMLDEGGALTRVRDVSRLRHCHDIVNDSYYDW